MVTVSSRSSSSVRPNRTVRGCADCPRRGSAAAADRHQHQSVAAERANPRENALLRLRLLVAVEDDQRIAPGGDRRFRRADDARIERIGEIGDDDGDELARAAS